MKQKQKSNSKNIIITMLILPLVIVGIVLLVPNKNNVKQTTKPNTQEVTITPSIPVEPGIASLSLDPNSGSSNGSITLNVYEDSKTEPVNAVDLGLKYDTTKLEFAKTDSTGSKFNLVPNPNPGQGKVLITGYVNPPESLKDKQLIAKVTFKILSSGETTINFVKDPPTKPSAKSAIYLKGSGKNIWDQVTTGGTYQLSK